MTLTGENWSTGRETLYSMGGRWMNLYGALVEWYWQGKTEVLGEKHYILWMVDEWMSMEHWWNDGRWMNGMEHWWNDTDRGKLKYWERNIIYCGWLVNEWVWNIGGMMVGEWMCVEHWWNDTDRGNRSAGRKLVTVPLSTINHS